MKSINSPGENSVGASNDDLSEAAFSDGELRARSGNSPAGEGSMGCRIAALIAMLLLALTGLVIWFYLRY